MRQGWGGVCDEGVPQRWLLRKAGERIDRGTEVKSGE